MKDAKPAARAHNIPLAVEDRIALEHLYQTLSGLPLEWTITHPVRNVQAALSAAYQAGWRAGVATRDAARAEP
jgi:hypothetical protein